MVDLYSEGWRQGTIITADLWSSSYRVDGNGDLTQQMTNLKRWVVCSQDCDLSLAMTDSNLEEVELRAVFSSDPPPDWGVRSRRHLLTEEYYVKSDSPRLLISPAALKTVAAVPSGPLPEARLRAFKTWLGLRYDRPAVPPALVGIAKEISTRCGSRRGRDAGKRAHDVLMQFDTSHTPPHIALFAIVVDAADVPDSINWLTEAATRIDPSLGVVASIDAGTRAEISLELLETSYAADLTQLTWRDKDPSGAT